MQTKDRLYVHVFSKIQSQTEAGLKLEVLKVAGSESIKKQEVGSPAVLDGAGLITARLCLRRIQSLVDSILIL